MAAMRASQRIMVFSGRTDAGRTDARRADAGQIRDDDRGFLGTLASSSADGGVDVFAVLVSSFVFVPHKFQEVSVLCGLRILAEWLLWIVGGIMFDKLQEGSGWIVVVLSAFLSGELPGGIWNISRLRALALSDNQLKGPIPMELSLVTLDLSENHLTGEIPNWIGNLSALSILLLKEGYRAATEFRISKDLRVEGVDYTTKRGTYTYEGNILEYMSGIYLSCNRITVEIPLQFGNLSEILSLNLSHNNLTGHIPSTFSRLKQIESLDLSHNNLIGRIPIQLTELYTLEVFNVSYNNLSGSIPSKKAQFGTFDESSYEVNPFLCRPPLHKSCDRPDSPPTPNASDDDDEENGLMDVYVFWVTFSVAYAIVLLVIAAILYINPYWRRAWFYLLNAASGLAIVTRAFWHVSEFSQFSSFASFLVSALFLFGVLIGSHGRFGGRIGRALFGGGGGGNFDFRAADGGGINNSSHFGTLGHIDHS
ncbi:receptor-like protein 56 [Hibiscus syriacus]|uniref:receptor-like protein 56 n=1 Tax=Hibiscus syriacus TaxID=106335 RepID=UPI001923D8CA|nr:receptor-like protein 56 [Hibiscus syriacus]